MVYFFNVSGMSEPCVQLVSDDAKWMHTVSLSVRPGLVLSSRTIDICPRNSPRATTFANTDKQRTVLCPRAGWYVHTLLIGRFVVHFTVCVYARVTSYINLLYILCLWVCFNCSILYTICCVWFIQLHVSSELSTRTNHVHTWITMPSTWYHRDSHELSWGGDIPKGHLKGYIKKEYLFITYVTARCVWRPQCGSLSDKRTF